MDNELIGNNLSKLALGTVQFGMNYGISNKNGQVSFQDVENILKSARVAGIDTIDTAHMYGASEEILGKCNIEGFKVVTKTVKIDKTLDRQQNFDRFKYAFFESQKKLGFIPLHGLMFHEPSDLLSNQGLALWDLVSDFKDNGYVEKLGVSVYTPEELEKIIEKVDIDIVQFPLNILDQRFLPILHKLKEKNIEIHTRSVFLQGLLLMAEKELSSYFNEIKPLLGKIPEPRLVSALGFVKNIPEVDKIVVGVTSSLELQQIVKAMVAKSPIIDYNCFKIEDERFILPQNWRL